MSQELAIRTTPSNIEAEATLLGALMCENRLIDSVADILKTEDFHEPMHQRVYEAILREASLGKSANPVTLKPYFDDDEAMKELGGPKYLARLTGDPSALLLSPGDTARHLAALARRRKMMLGLTTAAEACSDLDVSLPEILAHADEALSDTASEAIQQIGAGEAIGALMKEHEAGHAPGVTSGGRIQVLDDLLGPIRAKHLTICAARPGMGKSALAISYSIGAAIAGHGVLFVSLEMPAADLAGRIAADMCFDDGGGVPYPAIRDGNLNSWQMNRVVRAESEMRRLPFQIVDAGTLTTGRLAMIVRRWQRRMEARGNSLDLVVVDYLQLVRPDERMRSNYEAVSEVSRSLKALAKDCNVGVLALAQLSREVEKRTDKRPVLADLRDSGQIEQDADAVLFLARQEYYHRHSEPDRNHSDWPEWKAQLDAMEGEIEFILAKRRNGTTGIERGRFHGFYQAVRG